MMNYPITGYIEVWGAEIPLLDVPQISDDRWMQEARFNAESRFWDAHGFAPRDTAQALQWQEEEFERLKRKYQESGGTTTKLDENGYIIR